MALDTRSDPSGSAIDPAGEWRYLEARPHPWRRQLFVKGRRLPASIVWSKILTDDRSVEATAHDWDLPVDAVSEIVRYCESHRESIAREVEKERSDAIAARCSLEPPPSHR